MYTLNLPTFDVKLRKTNSDVEIFDPLRRKYIILTPEEWVRQHFVNYLVSEKGFPASLMANETTIKLNSLTKRCDTVVYNNNLTPIAVCEYKNPEIAINQEVFDQILRYNIVLRVKYLIVSNGINHFCCKVNQDDLSYVFLEEIPNYKELNT